jgi:hypothetical protein
MDNTQKKDFLNKYLIFKCISGSRAYGISGPDSDTDIRGLFIAPKEYHLGAFKHIEHIQGYEIGDDAEFFELNKFVTLAAACNPSIVEYLYTDEENILFTSEAYRKLRENRHLFLSKKARFSYSGYAIAQLKKLKSRDKWISNPQPEIPPSINQFCTFISREGESTKLDNESWDLFSRKWFLVKTRGQYVFRVYGHKDFTPGFMSEDGQNFSFFDIDQKILNEKNAHFHGVLVGSLEEYKEAFDNWKNYWNWKKNRNEKRAKLEEICGYDSKNAVHLVRLMKMCKEILTEGKVIIKRPDAEELIDIRNGKISYEELIKWAEEKDKELDILYEKSDLRHSADIEEIDKLLIEIKTYHWRKNE